jgi:predicted  nucleic acid-binding Zn-ribbon protein
LATINNTINNVFTNMTDAAKKMGLSVADLSDIVVDFTTSSQNGDQTANDLNAALAATSDAIALKLIPNIQALQYQGESLTQTFARLAAAQAALDAQKRTMEIALMEAQGKAVEALAAKREDELAALNATLKPLQQMIYAAQDLSTAFEDAQTAAQDAVSGQLESARSLSQSYQQVTKSINDSIIQLRGGALSPLTSAQKYADARQQLGAAFAASSGDAEMTAKLPGLVNTFLAASRDMNSSSAAYTKDYEKAMSMLNRAAEFSAASVSEQDALIATLTDLSTAIQDAAKNDENVALLREISDKLSNGGTGNAGTFLAQLVALNGTAETRKAAEDAAHAKALVDDQSSISRLAAQIENARQTMGSVTDPSAVSYYQREIELWEATLAKARTDYLILSGGIPSHASGLSTVPYDNYLMKAHAGEAVLTRSQASDWRSGSQGITSEDLRALRADVQRLTAIVAAGDHANVQATERVAQTQENAAWREEVRPRVN